ncbi:hypothetical protein Bca4012_083862 [Brassica carinata]
MQSNNRQDALKTFFFGNLPQTIRVIPSTVVCACEGTDSGEETSGKGKEVTTPIAKGRSILAAAIEITFWLVRRRYFRSISPDFASE